MIPGAKGPAAIAITRPQNGPEHGYALVRERLALGARDGAPAVGLEDGGGAPLTPRAGGFALGGLPISSGDRLEVAGLRVEVETIQPKDMK